MNLGNVKNHDIDAFGDAYEYLMTMYAGNAGKSGGEFFTPADVSELLTRLGTVGKKTINKVYDPACGSGSLLLKAEKVLGKDAVLNGFYGQEINVTTYNLCRINMFLHDIGFDKFDIACEDTLINPQHWDDEPFELIVSNPPYSIKWDGDDNPLLINDQRFAPAGVLAPKSKADFAFIMHSLSWLAPNGVAAIVCYTGIMRRGGSEQQIRKVDEIKQKQRISGFNSIFAVASIPMAKMYYDEFRRQMDADITKKLKIAVIYSFGANEAEEDENGMLGEEDAADTSALDQNSRDFLESAIKDYNEMFHTTYDTSSDKFQNYYRDVSLRMKNKELDLLIVVNMFLTGFDATTLNTLWVDKNLKMHGLIQAFSRTNRILNSIKTFGNIVCFRNLQKRVDSAISLFGDKDAGGIVLMKSFNDYYNGYVSVDGKTMPGYKQMVSDLMEKFPLSEPSIIGEKIKKNSSLYLVRSFVCVIFYHHLMNLQQKNV